MKLKLIPLILITFSLLSCTSKQTKKEIATHKSASLMQQYIKADIAKQTQAVKTFVQTLPPQEKISQLFIENLEGCSQFRSYETLDDVAPSDSYKPLVAGGYLFFSYNIASSRQGQKDFMQSITDYCINNSVIPPFLAVDQEGGLVNRLRKLNTPLPSQETVAQNYSIPDAYKLYSSQSEQMNDLGFHMNLAPVMEVCTPSNAAFLDGRSFGDEAATLQYGYACVNGYQNNGVGAVIKHFPGNTNTDPHTGLPEINLSKADLFASIEPFLQVLSLEPCGILMSHARTSALDSSVPSCLSEIWVTQILRNEYGYKGIIFSDDIFMGALADNGYPPEVAVVMAIDAGIDCIMISEKRFAKPARMIYQKMQEDSMFEQKVDKAVERIITYKIQNGLLKLVKNTADGYTVSL